MARRSKALPGLLGAAALAVAAYWYWSPLLTVHQMKAAVQARDAEAFNRHVDYPALRENMKDQVAGKPQPDAVLGGVARLLGGVVVDALVRPETVMSVLRHGEFAPRQARAATEGERDEDAAPPAWVSEREGVNRYVVRNDKVALVFARSGFADWKLSELRF